MSSLVESLRSFFAFGFSPGPAQELDIAIELLSEPHANYDDIANGIAALGARKRPGDIDRLVAMSNAKGAPDYWHEWIAEALLCVPSGPDDAVALLDRLAPATQRLLAQMLYAVNPDWEFCVGIFRESRHAL